MPGVARSRPRWGIWLFFLLVAGLSALVVLGGIFAYQYRYADLIYEGVQVAGIPLGGMTLDRAAAAIEDGLTPYPGSPITLRYEASAWSLAPADLGVSVDAETTAAAAYAVGRRGDQEDAGWGGLVSDLVTQLAAFQFGHRVTPVLQYDESRVEPILGSIAREIDVPPREGSLTIAGLEVRGSPGFSGRRVDQKATRDALLRLLRAGKGGSVDVVVVERPPAVVSVEEAVARATALLSEPLILVTEGLDGKQRFAVDQPTLRAWLVFSSTLTAAGTLELAVQLDRDQVLSFVKRIAGNLDRPALDAALDFDSEKGQVIVLKPSQAGQKLEVEAATDGISAALLGDSGRVALPAQGEIKNSSVAAPIQKEIQLPVTTLEPKVDSTKIAEMGIVELVSKGTTSFKGSSAERVHNIATGAEKFRGVVIPPGEDFSFNKNVGEVSAANGFDEGLIIGAERTAVGIGGGICQVSTTVFRAAFNGGFPITERHAHGYVVSWYGAPGLDATIFTPKVDFRFRNDTGHFLLVKPQVDTKKGEITFYLFGTRPDRVVESDPPQITNVRKPEPPIYEENASLAKGTIKQVDWAKDGLDAVVVRRVKYADGKVVEQKFVSKYQPWRAIYQYGPGTQLPAGAAGG